jgi:hypothetical protein
MDTPEYSFIATRLLPNGLTVHLSHADIAPASAADVIVGTTDGSPYPGRLTKYVLHSGGITEETFQRELELPVTLITNSPSSVLVIQTVGETTGNANDFIARNLAAGLRRVAALERRKIIWIPMLGSGAAGLTHRASLRLLLGVLEQWDPGPTGTVLLVCDRAEVAHELAMEWDTQGLPPRNLNPHVARALRLAHRHGQGRRVNSYLTITAIVSDTSTKSSAFQRLRTLVRMKPPPVANDAIEIDGDPLEFLDDELATWIRWARRRDSEQDDTKLWGRDLITAALLAHDDELAQKLEENGDSIDDLRDEWYRFVTAAGSGRKISDWTAWWRAAGVSIPLQYVRSGHSTEAVEGQRDRLGVARQAEAFARLVLDRSVEPPLSIALLGDWGSGKSFFMKEIRQQMEELNGKPGLHEHVLSIQFNAWHFSDSNLWAGLVTHIFDEIWRALTYERDDKQRKKLLAELASARGAVHEVESQLEDARTALRAAEEDRDEIRLRQIPVALVTAAERAGWLGSGAFADVERALKELSTTSGRLRQTVAAWLARPGWLFAWFVIALCTALGLPNLLANTSLGASTLVSLERVSAIVGAALGLLAPFVTAFRQVEHFHARLTDYQTSDEAKQRQREIVRLEAEAEAARRHLGELEARERLTEPTRRFETFIQDRVRSEQYRAQQGIIALVRRDFEQLSKLLREARQARQRVTKSDPDQESLAPVDRIVLFIDDLDRCRPEHVVHALEAVNLLLALDLFVVIVAVDSRWLVRALEVHYGAMLSANDGADKDHATTLRRSTPHNYLEKIFQITYALGQMDPTLSRDYLKYLAGLTRQTQNDREPSNAPRRSTPERDYSARESIKPQSESKQLAASSSPPQQPEIQPSEIQRPEQPEAREKDRPREPASIRITKHEFDFLTLLIPVLPTPRSVKRLFNVYRLLRASCTREDDAAFADGRYRPALFMLAVLFGLPAIAPKLFRVLHHRQAPFDNPHDTLLGAVDRFLVEAQFPESEKRAWVRLRDEIRRVLPTALVGQCSPEAYALARYSLTTGHEWHTWQQPE